MGSFPDWHEYLLAELGVLHLLAQAGRYPSALPPALGLAVFDAAVLHVVEKLKKLAKPTKDPKEIAQVGTISANNDAAIDHFDPGRSLLAHLLVGLDELVTGVLLQQRQQQALGALLIALR